MLRMANSLFLTRLVGRGGRKMRAWGRRLKQSHLGKGPDPAFPSWTVVGHFPPYVPAAVLCWSPGCGGLRAAPGRGQGFTSASEWGCFCGTLANTRAGTSAERQDGGWTPHIQPDNVDLVGKTMSFTTLLFSSSKVDP